MSFAVLFLSILVLFTDWSTAVRHKKKYIKNSKDFKAHKSMKLGQMFNHLANTQVTGPVTSADKFNSIFSIWNRKPASFDCSLAPKFPKDRRKNKQKLRIASYNAEWLFLFGGSGGVRCPGKDCPWKDSARARDHVMQAIQLILKLDADIIHFNEIEDCRILHVLMDLLPKNHGYRAYLIPGTDSMTGQNVGILTRIDPLIDLKRTEARKSYPVVGSTCGVSSSYISYSRGRKRSGTMGLSKHYLTKFQVGDIKIVWAGAHFIAHPSNLDRCIRREAQAAVLAEFIANETNGEQVEIIVTGDLNDHDDQIVGANNITALSSVLKILKQGSQLQSSASFVSDPLRRYTSWHDINGNCLDDGPPEHSLIDHVLVSPGLASRVVSVWMDHNKTVSCAQRPSDHWPVIVDFLT
jgi:exonuclease III